MSSGMSNLGRPLVVEGRADQQLRGILSDSGPLFEVAEISLGAQGGAGQHDAVLPFEKLMGQGGADVQGG